MNTCCTVVIGHVDHGKTALVRALTGADTDRLPEEKARGLSIVPGFAHCTYARGIMDFVDAPGHADFVQGMISGASGAQAALIVISMVDGVGAQTLEHLEIAGLLGITRAVIAVTKSDLLPLSAQPARLADIQGTLSQSPFATAPMVTCSAQTGDGIEDLHDALEKMLDHPTPPPPALHSYLPVDRAFTLPGRGTIVTGTLLGQDLSMETEVILQPRGLRVTLRSLQSRGMEHDRIRVGQRMAANLRGVSANDIPRGAVLCAKGSGASSTVIDAHLALLPAQAGTLKHMQELRVLFGTTSAVAQVRLFKDPDGDAAFAQLRFKNPVIGFAGQRAILRRLSPPETIGGAAFLDPRAAPTGSGDVRRLLVLRAARQQDTHAIAKAICAERHGIADLADIARLARLSPSGAADELGDTFLTIGPDLVSPVENVAAARAAMLDALAAYHLNHPLHLMAPRATIENTKVAPPLLQHVEDVAVADGEVRRNANMLALSAHDPLAQLTPAQRTSMLEIAELYRQSALATPSSQSMSEIAEAADLTQLLIDKGKLVPLPNVALHQTLIFHVVTLVNAANALAAAFPDAETFTTSAARTALNTSRRVIVPVLEHFDSLGVTLRQKDSRQIVAPNLISRPDGP